MYVGNPENDYEDFLASSVELNQRIKTVAGIIDAVMAGETPSGAFTSPGTSGTCGTARGARQGDGAQDSGGAL